MLHKVKSTYGEIAKFFPELAGKLSPATHKKQLLLEMARKSENRPSWKHPIGRYLPRYTSKKSKAHDPIFTKEIKKLAPHWFILQSEVANQKKRQLLKNAKRGEPRPNQKTTLGSAFCRYVQTDTQFKKQIKKIRPDWIMTRSEIANKKKKYLLKIAKNNQARPNQKTQLGNVISSYTCKKSKSYDPKFTNQIKKLAPHWFVSKSQTMKQNKSLLIKMAKNKEDRPNHENYLQGALVRYTSKKSKVYDPKFTNQIQKLNPLWFFSKADQKKKQLLDAAKKRKPRPIQFTTDGKALSRYTIKSSGCYDPDFTKQIKKIGPQWFVPPSIQKKQHLLEMARKGEPRPSQKTNLGSALSSYTTKACYDPIFTKQIKKLAPHWFKTCSTN